MGTFVHAEVDLALPARAVWEYFTDWPRQGEWIPFTRVEAVDEARSVGGRIRAWTGLGPIGFWDPMTITAWEESADGSARCEVLHTGAVVRGEGAFAVEARGPDASTFVFWDRLAVPGAGPVMRPLADWALRRFRARLEQVHAGR